MKAFEIIRSHLVDGDQDNERWFLVWRCDLGDRS